MQPAVKDTKKSKKRESKKHSEYLSDLANTVLPDEHKEGYVEFSEEDDNFVAEEFISYHRVSSAPPRGLITGIIKALRPRQWIKNILVIAAPMAALGTRAGQENVTLHMWLNVLAAFAAFCLAASAIYLVNDIQDKEVDSQHPVKKYRPIAFGVVPVPLAYLLAIVCIVCSVTLSYVISPRLCIVIAVYIVIQLGYCLGLKHQAVIDIAIVSSGFLIRAIAGGVAGGVMLSRWFLLVMAFGSLFMAAGKRYAELHLAEQTGVRIRKSLQYYTMSYLRFVWTLAATAVVICYGLWAFDSSHPNSSWYIVSMAPFTIAILRYAIDIDNALAGAPEEIALKDRVLQILAILWLGSIGIAAGYS